MNGSFPGSNSSHSMCTTNCLNYFFRRSVVIKIITLDDRGKIAFDFLVVLKALALSCPTKVSWKYHQTRRTSSISKNEKPR